MSSRDDVNELRRRQRPFPMPTRCPSSRPSTPSAGGEGMIQLRSFCSAQTRPRRHQGWPGTIRSNRSGRSVDSVHSRSVLCCGEQASRTSGSPDKEGNLVELEACEAAGLRSSIDNLLSMPRLVCGWRGR